MQAPLPLSPPHLPSPFPPPLPPSPPTHTCENWEVKEGGSLVYLLRVLDIEVEVLHQTSTPVSNTHDNVDTSNP